MRDIPFFTTENGVAGLGLKEIPYTEHAYITILDASDVDGLLTECTAFCNAAGAEKIYATGHPYLESFPLHTVIFRMSCEKEKIPRGKAFAVPVEKETVEHWREIYNDKMRTVPNAAYMSIMDCQKALEKGTLYFVFEDCVLIGIGLVDGECIGAVASVIPGKGRSVLSALCDKINADLIYLDVASDNDKAMRLYMQMGFQRVEELSRWYRIK